MELSMVEQSFLDEETRRIGIGSGRADSPGAVAIYAKTVASAEGNKSQSSWRSAETKGKCYLCKRPGHFQRDCPKKKAESGSVKQQVRVAATVNKDVAFVVTPRKVGTKKAKDRTIDSGASRHMAGDKGHLEEYRTLDKLELVRLGKDFGLGDNHVVEAEGLGNARIRVVLEDGRVENSMLCDVLYIKVLAVNLLSVSATANKGYDVPFSKGTCRILDTERRLSAVELSRATCGSSWYVYSCSLSSSGPRGADPGRRVAPTPRPH